MKDIDKLIETVHIKPDLNILDELLEQFELINEPKQTGMRLHTKRPGSMPFTF